MKQYNRDSKIMIKHSPVRNSRAQQLNQVGAGGWVSIIESVVEYSDSNSVFVSGSGSDTSGTGTQANPYKTIQKGINETDADKHYVIVLNSGDYVEGPLTVTTDFRGLYAATGQTPRMSLREYSGGYVPTDYNTKFVSKAGNDTSGTGTQVNPYLTINKAMSECSAGQSVMILDSGEYEEIITQSACAVLRSKTGNLPILRPTREEYITSEQNILSSIDPQYSTMCAISDNRYVIATTSSGNIYFVIVRRDSIIKSSTLVDSATRGCRHIVLSPINNNFIFVYTREISGEGYKIFIAIYNSAGSCILLPTKINGTLAQKITDVCALDNGSYVITWEDAADQNLRWMIVSSSGSVISGPNAPGYEADTDTGRLAAIDGAFVMYSQRSVPDGAAGGSSIFAVFNNSGSLIKNWALFLGNNITRKSRPVRLASGNVAFFWGEPGDTSYLRMKVYDSGLNNVVLENTVIKSYAEYVNLILNSIAILPDSNIVLTAGDVNDYYVFLKEDGTCLENHSLLNDIWQEAIYVDNHYVIRGYSNYFRRIDLTWQGINLSDDFVFEGIAIDYDNSDCYNRNGLSSPSGKNLELHNSDVHNYNQAGCMIAAVGPVDFSFSRFFNGKGLTIEADSVEFDDCQFYNLTDDYAVTIDGAAAADGDIDINHCDLFNNYGGVKLLNNSGSEKIRNSILHNNANGHEAEVEASIEYCICTDAATNFDTALNVTTANPCYVNEGAIDPDDIDLNIKTRVSGFPIDSPALRGASDGRNQGSLDVAYILQSETWQQFLISKHYIKPSYPPVGASSIVRRDGSVTSKKDAVQERVVIQWRSLSPSELANLLLLIKSSSYRILLYPDPLSAPSDYDEYALIYSTIDADAGAYCQSDLGVQARNAIVLERRFE